MEGPFEVLSQVARVLEAQGIVYAVVGSFASSMRGIYRATADVDILADIELPHIEPLVAALKDTFHIDETAVRRAVERRGSFNAIHYAAIFKIDFFVARRDALTRQQLARRRAERMSPDAPQEIYVATAEDTALAKLLWYRAGGAVSQAQWNDVLGIFGAQGEGLDAAYLREWADKLGVSDLLEQAVGEAGE
jgi:hypothetical protein